MSTLIYIKQTVYAHSVELAARAQCSRAVTSPKSLQIKSILLIDHKLDTVFAFADRISVMVYGQVIAAGKPDEIRAITDVRRAYLGEE